MMNRRKFIASSAVTVATAALPASSLGAAEAVAAPSVSAVGVNPVDVLRGMCEGLGLTVDHMSFDVAAAKMEACE